MSKQSDNMHYIPPDLTEEIPSTSVASPEESLRMFCCCQEFKQEFLVATFLLFPYFFSDMLTYTYSFHSGRISPKKTISPKFRALTGDTEISKQST